MSKKSIGIIIVAVIVAYFASGYFNGYRLKSTLTRSISPYVRTNFSIDNAYINSFTGNGYLEGISISNPPGVVGKYAFEIDRIDIQGGPTSLHGEIIKLDALHIQGIRINVMPSKGGVNMAQIFGYRRDLGTDVGLKEIHLEVFKVDPIDVSFGPELLTENPYAFSLKSIVITEDDFANRRIKTLGVYLADQILDQLEALQEAKKMPLPTDSGPAVKSALRKARSFLKKYEHYQGDKA